MTLRLRITAMATVALVVVLAIASVAIVTLVSRQLNDDLLAQNEDTLDEIAAGLELGIPLDDVVLPVGSDGTEFLVFQDGLAVRSSVVLTADVTDFGFIDELSDEEFAALDEFVDVDLALYEQSARVVVAPDGEVYEVVALSPNVIVERSVDRVQSTLFVVIPVLAVVFAALTWLLTGRVLRPVVQMIDRAQQIGADTLDQRLTAPGTNDEIDRLATTLNGMLDRLDAAAQQQRQFVSDASHELRTPLTVMIGEAELAASTGDHAQLVEANERIVSGGQRLTQLIDDLLSLARSGEAAFRLVDVDLDDVVREQAALQPRTIDTSGVQPARITADQGAISRVLRNLLDNAARYARDRIVVTTEHVSIDGQPMVQLVVDDDGPGIPETQRVRVFERFARADEARARSTGGTGLGLAIAHAVIEAHGGTIVVTDAPLGGARFVVTLPA